MYLILHFCDLCDCVVHRNKFYILKILKIYFHKVKETFLTNIEDIENHARQIVLFVIRLEVVTLL